MASTLYPGQFVDSDDVKMWHDVWKDAEETRLTIAKSLTEKRIRNRQLAEIHKKLEAQRFNLHREIQADEKKLINKVKEIEAMDRELENLSKQGEENQHAFMAQKPTLEKAAQHAELAAQALHAARLVDAKKRLEAAGI